MRFQNIMENIYVIKYQVYASKLKYSMYNIQESWPSSAYKSNLNPYSLPTRSRMSAHVRRLGLRGPADD